MRLKLNHIKTKLILSTMIVVILSSCISGFSIYIYINKILTNRIVQDNTALVDKMAQQIDYYVDDIVKYGKIIILNDQVQSYMKKGVGAKNYDYYSNVQKLESVLKEFVVLRDAFVDDIFIISKNDEILSVGNLYGTVPQEAWYLELINNNQVPGFSGIHTVTKNSEASRLKVISYIMNIYDKNKAEAYLGKLVINIKYDIITKPVASGSASIKDSFLYDKNFNLLYESSHIEDFRQQYVQDILKNGQPVYEDKNSFYVTQKVPGNGWVVLGMLPKKLIYTNLRFINLIIILIVAICLVLVSIIVFPIINSLTKPLMILVQGMKRVSKGDLNTEVDISSGDEIEELSKVFNKMVKDVKQSIESLILKEKHEREMELQLFISRINPHFIYNTLNTIVYLARRINAQDIITVTKSFIAILYQTIGIQAEELTTLREEIVYINHYISIIKYRYNEAIEIAWNIDEALLDKNIHRMIIYPLVENSIFHGIAPKETGKVVISAYMEEDDSIRLCIQDDGIGMEDEKLEEIHRLMDGQAYGSKDRHIGLSNVNDRLKLLYGEKYRLRMESSKVSGTLAWFLIPGRMEEIDNNKKL